MALEATAETLASHRSRTPAGDGTGEPVIAVHGFAQNAACLGPLADALAESHRVVAVDAPGHGGSARHASADLVAGAALLVATGGTGTYLGYSMGGRLCLTAAVHHPEAVQRLVLISTTAGIEDDRVRAERADWDEQHARRLEQDGLDAFIEEWLALPLFAGLPSWARFDEERRTNTVDGLAASLRHAGAGSMTPLWERLGEIDCPVLLVTGSRDERYVDLGSRLAETIGSNARHVTVPGAGHSTHLEQPTATADAILAFCAD